jgi:hypothetical protein
MENSMMQSISMKKKSLPDLSFLTESEKNKILDVLDRDEHVQKQQKKICS